MSSPQISASALETAAVTLAGATAGAFFEGFPLLKAVVAGVIAAAGVLGYHFAASNVKVAA